MKELPRVLLPLFKLHTLGLVMCAVSGACTGLLVFCVFSITHYYPSNGDWPLSHPFMPREILIAESAYLGARYGVSIYMLAGFGIAAFNLIRRFEFILE